MASWRPRLEVRRSRGGGVSSPTTNGGVAFFGAIGVILSSACLYVGATRDAWALIGLVVGLWPIRDMWAWFAATADERSAFRDLVLQLEAERGLSASQMRLSGGREVPLLALLGIVTCLAGALLNRVFYVAGLGLFSLAVFAGWDLWRHSREHP